MRTLIRDFALAAAACACVAPAAAQSYRCVVYPLYEGRPVSTQTINNLGEAAGSVYVTPADIRSAIFRADGTVKYVHRSPSFGGHINNNGNAAFTLLDKRGVSAGVAYYDAARNTARAVRLPLRRLESVSLTGIDDANAFYGNVLGNGSAVPFRVQQGSYVDLTPVLGENSTVLGVSPAGDMTGALAGPNGRGSAYRYSDGQLVDLGIEASVGYAINTSLTVGGLRIQSTGPQIGFVAIEGNVSDVIFAGDFLSWVVALNEAGDAVGESSDQIGRVRGFLWRQGLLTDLTAVSDQVCPAGAFGSPIDINDHGVILGSQGALLVPTLPLP